MESNNRIKIYNWRCRCHDKKVFLLVAIITLILSMQAYGFAATDNQPAIMLNGTEIEAVASVDSGNVYLPLRAVGEALGYKIQWSEKDNTISVSKPELDIMIDLNNHKIISNDHAYYMSGDYTIIGDSTYMGTNFFSDNFGLKVWWDRPNGIIQLVSVKKNAISIKTIKEDSETDKTGKITKEQIATMLRTQGKHKDSYYLEGLSYDLANLDDDADWEIAAKIDGGVHLGQFFVFDKDSGGDYRLIAERDWKVEQWDFDNPVELEGKKLFKLVTRTGGTGIDVFNVHLWYFEEGEFIEAWQGVLKERSMMAGPETFYKKMGGYQLDPEGNRLYVWETTHQLDQDGVTPQGDLKTSLKVYWFNGASFIQEP